MKPQIWNFNQPMRQGKKEYNDKVIFETVFMDDALFYDVNPDDEFDVVRNQISSSPYEAFAEYILDLPTKNMTLDEIQNIEISSKSLVMRGLVEDRTDQRPPVHYVTLEIDFTGCLPYQDRPYKDWVFLRFRRAFHKEQRFWQWRNPPVMAVMEKSDTPFNRKSIGLSRDLFEYAGNTGPIDRLSFFVRHRDINGICAFFSRFKKKLYGWEKNRMDSIISRFSFF